MQTTTAWAFFTAVQINESASVVVPHPDQSQTLSRASNFDPAVNVVHLALCIALQVDTAFMY